MGVQRYPMGVKNGAKVEKLKVGKGGVY